MAHLLPRELWRVVFDHCVRGQKDVGQQWITRRVREGEEREWKTLRALTQVDRCMRSLAMPLLWRSVEMRPLQEDFAIICNLRQLADELPHGGNAFVERVDIVLPTSRLGGYYDLDEEDMFEEECLRDLEPEDMTDTRGDGVLPMVARLLSRRFIGCPRLKSIRWKGWLSPDLVLLDNLSRCPKLSEIALDVGLAHRQEVFYAWGIDDEKTRSITLPPTHSTFPSLETVEFSIDLWIDKCDCDRTDRYSSDFHSQQAAGFVDCLLAYGAIPKDFKFDRPALLDEGWMAPVWVAAEHIEGVGRRPWDKWREELLSAKAFSALLRKHVQLFAEGTHTTDKNDGMQHDEAITSTRVQFDVTAIARSIMDVIHQHEELKQFQWMFPKVRERNYHRCPYSSEAETVTYSSEAETIKELQPVAKAMLIKALGSAAFDAAST